MFKLNPAPEFDCDVSIPVPGREPATLTLVFRHKSREDVAAYFTALANTEKVTAGVLLGIVCGWRNCDAEFNEDNLQKLIDNYHGSVRAIFQAYGTELAEGRRKNS